MRLGMMRWPRAGSMGVGGHHSELVRTQSQGLWDQACFQGTGEGQEGFRNRNSSRPKTTEASPQSEAKVA